MIARRLDRQALREIAPVQVGEKLGRQGVAFHDRPLGVDDALLAEILDDEQAFVEIAPEDSR